MFVATIYINRISIKRGIVYNLFISIHLLFSQLRHHTILLSVLESNARTADSRSDGGQLKVSTIKCGINLIEVPFDVDVSLRAVPGQRGPWNCPVDLVDSLVVVVERKCARSTTGGATGMRCDGGLALLLAEMAPLSTAVGKRYCDAI